MQRSRQWSVEAVYMAGLQAQQPQGAARLAPRRAHAEAGRADATAGARHKKQSVSAWARLRVLAAVRGLTQRAASARLAEPNLKARVWQLDRELIGRVS